MPISSANGVGQSVILLFPLEIVSYIFRFLPISDLKSVALVCSAWSKAVEDPVLWKNAFISLGSRREIYSPLLVQTLRKRCIQRLRFKHMSTGAQILQVCKQLGPNLRVLSLQGCRCVNESLLEMLSKLCPELERLDLSRCRQLEVVKTAAWIDSCSKIWRNLRTLDLSACKDLSDLTVSKIALNLFLLTELCISGCRGVTIATWQQLAKNVPSLEYLDISRSDITDEVMLKFSQIAELKLQGINLTACKQLTDNGVVPLVKYQTSMHVLKLACVDITNTALTATGKYLPSLKVLDLNSCRQITDGPLSNVKGLMLNLNSLNFYSCYQLSSKGLAQFLCWTEGGNRKVPLRTLILNGCSAVSDDLVSRLSRVLINLQELDLSSCLHVTDTGLSAICSNLYKLQCLRLSWCINITDQGLTGAICEQSQNTGGCKDASLHKGRGTTLNKSSKDNQIQLKISHGIDKLEKLRVLDISHCTCLTDRGLKSICCLKNLQSFNINMCTQITDQGITNVAESLQTLRHLAFSGCNSVTDIGLSQVAIHLQRLEALDMSKCDNVTDKSILNLAKYTRSLTHLDLSMCSQITRHSVDQLEVNIPGLVSLQLRYSGSW